MREREPANHLCWFQLARKAALISGGLGCLNAAEKGAGHAGEGDEHAAAVADKPDVNAAGINAAITARFDALLILIFVLVFVYYFSPPLPHLLKWRKNTLPEMPQFLFNWGWKKNSFVCQEIKSSMSDMGG